MTRRHRARVLNDIVSVREVQERAAKMAVARVNADLSSLGQERSDAGDQLDHDQRQWASAMSGPGLDPGLAGAWASAVHRSEDQVREVEGRIEETEALKARCSDDWRLALSRSDLASGLARKASRARDRAQEEAALADLTDRLAHKGAQP